MKADTAATRTKPPAHRGLLLAAVSQWVALTHRFQSSFLCEGLFPLQQVCAVLPLPLCKLPLLQIFRVSTQARMLEISW